MSLALHGFNGDVLINLTIGRWILAHGHGPLHNHWTVAMAGRPFSDTEWLFGVWVALAYQWGGRLGVYLSVLPFMAVTAWFVGVWASRVKSWHGMIVATATGDALMIVCSPRPQWVSYAAFALGLWAIQQARRDHWGPLVGFLAIIPLWTNMHASVVLAPVLLLNEVVWGQGRYRKRMGGATGAAVALMLCRAGGAAAGTSFFSHVLTPGVLNVIEEWQSPNFHVATGFVLLPAILLAWTVLLPWAWRQKQWASVLWMLLGPLVSLWAIRFSPYMVLGVVAVLADSGLDPVTSPIARPYRVLGLSTMLLINGLIAFRATQPGFFAPQYPVSAIQYLTRHRAAGVITWEQWGDAANLAGIKPWMNSQTQLWSHAAWWMPFVQTRHGASRHCCPGHTSGIRKPNGFYGP
jgi:hypothetical protein